jgi:hypothetical protein
MSALFVLVMGVFCLLLPSHSAACTWVSRVQGDLSTCSGYAFFKTNNIVSEPYTVHIYASGKEWEKDDDGRWTKVVHWDQREGIVDYASTGSLDPRTTRSWSVQVYFFPDNEYVVKGTREFKVVCVCGSAACESHVTRESSSSF